MMRLYLFLFLLLSLSLMSNFCSPDEKNTASLDNNRHQSTDSTEFDLKNKAYFSCTYMGEKPPADIPLKFAPGVVSTKKDDSCFEVSVTGEEILFSRDGNILITKQNQNGKWDLPSPAFEGFEPSFSKDGRKIYFNSRAPIPGSKVANNVWYSEKLNGQWAKPNYLTGAVLDQVMHAPSIAINGNMYASGITCLKYQNGKYGKAEKLNPPITGYHPFVSADESFIIFDKKPPDSGYGADLYITFRKPDSTWTKPAWLGDKINTDKLETNASVTADKKFMFFTRNFDIYWVKADFINQISKELGIKSQFLSSNDK